jgi:DNA-binding response OmpR family regulator
VTTQPPLEVLFVDRDALRADMLAHALPQPSAAQFATSAVAALQLIETRPPDLIITQLDLPDISGVELVQRAQQLPTARQMLMMVIAERATAADKIAALRAGADDFLVAPVTPQDFHVRVQLLSRFRSPRSGLLRCGGPPGRKASRADALPL